MNLYYEILEQPQVLAGLLRRTDRFRDIAAALKQRDIRYVVVAARGSSDHAGLYAKYLFGSVNGLPVALAAPSLFTMYRTPPRLSQALVLGISQSGVSADIVSVVEAGRREAAATLAITNDPASPLAQAAEFVIDLEAGQERAVAATKTYTAQLMSIALLSAALAGDEGHRRTLESVPGLVAHALDLDQQITQIAERYRYMDQCAVLGRGFNYATAFEWSLKLKELAYVAAEPYSSADFQHGPIALVEGGFPVLVVLPEGAVFQDMLGLVRRLALERRAELFVISNVPAAVELAHSQVLLPEGLPEWISPMVCIVPAQLFVYHLTRTKGFDPEHPRGLAKVTSTQ